MANSGRMHCNFRATIMVKYKICRYFCCLTKAVLLALCQLSSDLRPFWFSTGAQIYTGANPVLTLVTLKKLAENLKVLVVRHFLWHYPPNRCLGVVGRTVGARKVKKMTIWRGIPTPIIPLLNPNKTSLLYFNLFLSWLNQSLSFLSHWNVKSLCISHFSFFHLHQNPGHTPPASGICRIPSFYNGLVQL